MLHLPGYKAVEQLSESQHSLIYRGCRVSDNRPVILKQLRKESPTSDEIARFRREYELTRYLDVSDIIRAYDLLPFKKTFFIVFEDIGAASLNRLALTAGECGLEYCLTVALRITGILGAIHAANVIHKDINPSNIVMNPDTGEIKLIDFGIATMLPRENPIIAHPNVLEGTLAYISPEQTGRMNRVLDYRTDFYALGVTLYELLAGVLPFTMQDPMELVHAHIALQPTAPCDLDSRIPQPVSDIIMKLLAKNAEDRYQSSYALKADLEFCLANLENLENLQGFTVAQHDISDRFHIPQKLYGREDDLDTLMRAFDRVSQGAQELLLVTGASGVGKSSLIYEVRKPMTLKNGYLLSGKFHQFQRNIPYSAITQAFNQFCNLLLTTSPNILSAWKTRIMDALGGNGQVLIDVIPRLELIIGPQPAVAEVGFQAAQNRFSLYFQLFMRAVSGAEYPLALFLDDLQWADLASMRLLRLLLTDPQSHHLLVIGAYRDAEVAPAHPLMTVLDDLQQAGVTITRIHLDRLAQQDVSALLSETLGGNACPLQGLENLAEVVHGKTQGNAFFVTQLLHSLHDQGWIVFDASARRWKWDFEHILSVGMTDNVVELMVSKIRRLAPSTQHVLKLAACVGNTFDLHTLSVIWEHSARDTLTELLHGVKEGLIVPLDHGFWLPESGFEPDSRAPVGFKFVHDRVEQAAYSLIEEGQRAAIHLRIGRLLLAKTPESELQEQIFTLVQQLNMGTEDIEAPDERLGLARLNLLAARRAKTATAYALALNYALTGIALLPEPCWQSCYDLALGLHETAAESAYLCGDFSQMDREFEIIVQHARNPLDTVNVHDVKIEALKAGANLETAIATGLRMLEQLGVRFPARPSKIHLLLALLRLKLLLAGKHPENFMNLPDMKDPQKLAALRIILSIGSAANFAAPNLLPLLVFEDVSLSVRYGNTPGASFNYATYAFSLCGILGNINTGHQFGKLAFQLLQRFDNRSFKARTLFMVNYFVTHWKEHAANTLAPLLDAYHSGLETGDFEYAGYGIGGYIRHAFFLGNDLATLEQAIKTYQPMVRQLKQEMIACNIALCHQMLENLRDETEQPHRLRGTYYQEETMPRHVKENRSVIFSTFLYRLMLCQLFHVSAEARDYADAGETYQDGARGTLLLPCFHFYASLARLANLRQDSPGKRRRLLRKVKTSQKCLKTWAAHAPMNHLHKWQLVEAERCRVTGKPGKAAILYDNAIDSAREQGYVNEEALACELAGRFFLEQGRSRLAQLYLAGAREAYQRWGAYAKVQDVETCYPRFFVTTALTRSPAAMKTTLEGPTIEQAGYLDVSTLMKASQMLSEEIQLERLLQRLMRVVIENAGAERGCLMLPDREAWQIRAEGHVEEGSIVTGITTSHNLVDFASQGVVNFVIRTREPVVLHDALREGLFTQDPHITSRQVRSVLCLPLLNQGKLTGVVYLENSVSAGAFTTGRIAVLNLLSSQAAISIENAALYETLENKVAERTQQLAEAKEHAEAANKAKSAFLANMNHELRTPLTAISGFAQVLAHHAHTDKEAEHLSVILRSSDHLLTLINQVLDLSKIEAGHVTLEESDMDLFRLLDDLHDMFSIKAANKGVQLTFERGADVPCMIRADEVKLRQVLMNLLNNAIKFTEEGEVQCSVFSKQYSVSSSQDSVTSDRRSLTTDHCLLFTVKDTGPGIAPEDLEQIFEAFGQTATGRQAREGTGLGLAISRQFIRLMGGDIHVSSKVGVGSTFSFDVMVEPVEHALTDKSQTVMNTRPVTLEPGQPRYRLLIVDDNPENRTLFATLLAPFEFDLREALNGQEAIELWRDWRPHLIWMDVRMPIMGGYDAVHAIRTFEASPSRTVIIAVSASSFEEERDVALAQGCDDFLRKPFREQEIFAMLTRHLGVRFVHEEEQAIDAANENIAQLPSALAQLPPDLPEQLRYAATLCDIDMVMLIIEDIRAYQPAAADILLRWANNFQYEQILQILQQGRQTP